MAQGAEAGEDMGSWEFCETAWGWGVMWRGWYGEVRPRAGQELRGGRLKMTQTVRGVGVRVSSGVKECLVHICVSDSSSYCHVHS